MSNDTKPKDPKSTKTVTKPKKKKDDLSTLTAVGSSVKTTRDNNSPSDQFKYVFGPQEKAIHDWMQCVFDPVGHSARVPNAAGGFELYTQLWRSKDSGSAVADANGNLFVGVACNGWTESGNAYGTPNPNCSCLGYTTMGTAAMGSTGAVAIDTVPSAGSALAGSGLTGSAMDSPTDSPLTPNTRIRLVAAMLRVHSVLAANTPKGEITVAGSVNPAGVVRGGAINACSVNDIFKTTSGVMVTAKRGIASWKSDEILSIVAIPAEEQAFQMIQVPATGAGSSTIPLFSLGCFGTGFTAGDSVRYEVYYVWETELTKTNEAEGDYKMPVTVNQADLDAAKKKMRPYAALSNHKDTPSAAYIHSLPFIETLAETRPAAVAALGNHPIMSPVGHKPQIYRPVTTLADGPTSFLGKVVDAGKEALGTIADKGWLKNIPVVGNILDTVAKGISSFFG